jgi:RNA polymerase sigma-70 factor (ECF subfamily)
VGEKGMESNVFHENVVRMMAGDGEAFRRVTAPLLPLLYRRLRSMLPASAVEDVVQDTLLDAWRKRATLQDPERITGWLLQIGKRNAIDWLRRRKPLLSFESSDVCAVGGEECIAWSERQMTPEAMLLRKQSGELLREALGTLPARQGSILEMRTFAELTPQETALQLSISTKTVYATEAQARAKLRQNSTIKRAWDALCTAVAALLVWLTRSKSSTAASWSLASVGVTCTAVSVGAMCLSASSPVSLHEPPSRPYVRASQNIDTRLRSLIKRKAQVFQAMGHSQQTQRVKRRKGERTMKVKTLATTAGLLATLAFGVPTIVHAKPKANKAKVAPVYRKVQVFNMAGSDIMGGTAKPFWSRISGTQRKTFKSIIKVRHNWKRRIRSGIHQL